MRRVVAVLFAVAVLGAAAAAYAGSSTPTGLPSGNAVFGGGHFAFYNTGTDRDFSLSATKGTSGSKAVGTLIYSQGETIVQVTCLNISGNEAVVGGIVRSSSTETLGTFDYMMFTDNSMPGSGGTPDAVSGLGLTGQQGKQPCPAFDPTVTTNPLTGGDVLVHAA